MPKLKRTYRMDMRDPEGNYQEVHKFEEEETSLIEKTKGVMTKKYPDRAFRVREVIEIVTWEYDPQNIKFPF
jgi:hypothetical protein